MFLTASFSLVKCKVSFVRITIAPSKDTPTRFPFTFMNMSYKLGSASITKFIYNRDMFQFYICIEQLQNASHVPD